MTDKEIIKALECCHSTKGGCKDCPLNYRRSADCVDYLEENALDLIRRQQEKINHFAEANKMVVDLKTVKTDKTEDEILKRLLTQRVEFIPNNKDIEDIQMDAVINFANELMCNLDGDIETYANAGHGLDVYGWLKSYLVSRGAIKAEPEMFPKQKGEENA